MASVALLRDLNTN